MNKFTIKVVAAFLLLSTAFLGCKSDDEIDNGIDHEALRVQEHELLNEYLKENDITQKPTESGLYYLCLEEGNGEQPEKGVTVSIEYKGMFLSGKVFDEGKFDYKIGDSNLIKGFAEGVNQMTYDEKVKLIIPSSIGYGDYGYASIPGHTTLIFEVSITKKL